MSRFFFYNNRKPRKFNYTPILYNPEEEERAKNMRDRIEKVKREMGVLPEEKIVEKKEFKNDFLSQTHHLKKRKERENSGKNTFIANNGLLILILVILFTVFYLWISR